MSSTFDSLTWTGQSNSCLNRPETRHCGQVVLGCYGGSSTSGATKNEDAAFILAAQDRTWIFTSICNAHCSSESALLVTEFLSNNAEAIATCLSYPVGEAFLKLEQFIVGRLLTPTFQKTCRKVEGETALLLCAQKGAFLWWLCIGDNLIYLFHPDFAKLNQFALNQRHFFEWIGHANSLALDVPCYTRGVTELRSDTNHIMLLTDGVLEFEGSPFTNSGSIYELYQRHPKQHDQIVKEMLKTVHKFQGRDSATIISFGVEVKGRISTMPSS